MLTVISLGAGVQSTTMALMAAKGEITPMPNCAIFADTGWEPKSVYEHLERLIPALPFPVHKVSAGNIRDNIITSKNTTGGRFASVPWYTENGGMGRRQCTREFKVEPLERKQRKLLGYKKGLRDGGTCRGMNNKQFMHRSCKPLDEVDLSTAEDHGQLSFLGECDGMCGV